MGIDSGFAIAGVIGHKTFQYDLCGDAVNTAARMCSYSEPGRVNVSQRTHALVRHRFSSEEQAEREIKGKGRMKTYFLNNTPPPATADSDDGPSQHAWAPVTRPRSTLQPSEDAVGMMVEPRASMVEAGGVRCAPTLEALDRGSSPRHSRVSVEGSSPPSPPRESASRVSWRDQSGLAQSGAAQSSCPRAQSGSLPDRSQSTPADSRPDEVELSGVGIDLPPPPLSC